jgi:lipid II:glycine glycyltransferase (peptidoglycan interpeptide bridge formation enzyme)
VKLWLAERDGRLLGGALNFYWNRHAVGWHSAASGQALDSHAFAILVANAVEEACDRGFAWFDLNPSGGLEGVAAFKSRFGGERRAIERLRYQTWLVRQVGRARVRSHS